MSDHKFEPLPSDGRSGHLAAYVEAWERMFRRILATFGLPAAVFEGRVDEVLGGEADEPIVVEASDADRPG